MTRSNLLLVMAFACTLGASAAHAQDPADIVARMDRLESAIRNLTGSVEQLQYRNQLLEQQVQRLQAALQGAAPAPAAMPPRPVAPYGSPAAVAPAPSVVAAAPQTEPAPALNRRGDAFDPTQNPNAPGAPRALGTSTVANEPPPAAQTPAPGLRPLGAPLDLSAGSTSSTGATPQAQLPPPPPANPSATGAKYATLPPSNSPRDAYDLAYGYVLHRDYALAADTFRTFLHQFPSDRLAPEAQYWLGESLFQQQQYRDAAEAFLVVSTKYETTARAPEALFRLGQSLAALGEKEAACASLGEVMRKYPRTPVNLKQAVEREQKRARC
jgi:tol-pal system protein YbgF